MDEKTRKEYEKTKRTPEEKRRMKEPKFYMSNDDYQRLLELGIIEKDVWYKNEMRKIKLQLIDDSTKKLKKPKEPPCDIFEELLKQKQKK